MVRRARFGCSFCGKDRDAVARLIAGPNGAFICDQCVTLCNRILAASPPPSAARRRSSGLGARFRRLLNGPRQTSRLAS